MRVFALLCVVAVALAKQEWSHADQGAWSDYSPGCGGDNQSPINLFTGMFGEKAPTAFSPLIIQANQAAAGTWKNNGHSLQLDFDDVRGGAAKLNTDGERGIPGLHNYALSMLHLHSPSEHQIDGKSFAIEAHFFFTEGDHKAVVSVMFQDGGRDGNAQLDVLLRGIPTVGHDTRIEAVDLTGLLPDLGSAAKGTPSPYYYYVGSTTTPPCAPDVTWLVFKQPLTASTDQIARFNKFYRGNAREVQDLGDRMVTLNSPSPFNSPFPDLEKKFTDPIFFD